MLEQCARASIPGDPEAIHEAARGLERDAERAGEEILVDIRLARDTALAGWSAPSADEFGAFVSRALSFETDQIEAQRAAAQIWHTYAEELRAAQRALEQAVENERSAERASERAEEDSRAEGKAEDAVGEAREDQVSAARDAAEAAERAAQGMERVIGGLASVPQGPVAPSPPPEKGLADLALDATGGFAREFTIGLVEWGDPASTAAKVGTVAAIVNPKGVVQKVLKEGGQFVVRKVREKTVNSYKGPLDRGHLDAARRERGAEVVARKPNGEPYDHVNEVREAQRGLLNRIKTIKRRLSDPRLTQDERSKLESELGEASRLLDHTEGFVPR